MALDLQSIRDDIDDIDKKIVELFEERMKLCSDVAEYKIENGKKVLDRDREIDKINKVKGLAHNSFNRHGVGELFSQIMSISRKMQYQILSRHGIGEEPGFEQIDGIDKENVTVVYQGVPGAYSNKAMQDYFGKDVHNINVKTFRDAMEYIKLGKADYAVLPIENSTAGIVNDTYDLLMEYNNYIVDQTEVKVEHSLLGLPEAQISDISIVYSHPQGLMQCSRYLEEHKDWKRIAQANTAGSAKKVIEDGDICQAAIASESAASIYGLKILDSNINDNDKNTTRFIIIGNKKVYRKDAGRIFVCFELPHESGSLFNILSNFIYNGLNMTKIESRPIADKSWEYRFYVEFEGKLDDAAVNNALRGIAEEANFMKIVGNY
ncbi:MAG: prephenate dehydratase [Lachnospiraceae bacterium]|nr:prephenate dehydratase [Lachnospiraceae bacterium]